MVLNLVKGAEKRPRESILQQELAAAIAYINKSVRARACRIRCSALCCAASLALSAQCPCLALAPDMSLGHGACDWNICILGSFSRHLWLMCLMCSMMVCVLGTVLLLLFHELLAAPGGHRCSRESSSSALLADATHAHCR